MKKPISVFCLVLMLAVSFTGCDKTPSEVEVDDSVINVKDFWIYSNDEVVAKLNEDFGIFRFQDEVNSESTPLQFPDTYGYKLSDVHTYRGAKVGDSLEELAEKYDGLLFQTISNRDSDVTYRNMDLKSFFALEEEADEIWLYLDLFRIGDEYYQPTDPKVETFYEEAEAAFKAKEMTRYDRYMVFFEIKNNIVELIKIDSDSFNSIASRGYE